MRNSRILEVGDPLADSDAVNKLYCNTASNIVIGKLPAGVLPQDFPHFNIQPEIKMYFGGYNGNSFVKYNQTNNDIEFKTDKAYRFKGDTNNILTLSDASQKVNFHTHRVENIGVPINDADAVNWGSIKFWPVLHGQLETIYRRIIFNIPNTLFTDITVFNLPPGKTTTNGKLEILNIAIERGTNEWFYVFSNFFSIASQNIIFQERSGYFSIYLLNAFPPEWSRNCKVAYLERT